MLIPEFISFRVQTRLVSCAKYVEKKFRERTGWEIGGKQ